MPVHERPAVNCEGSSWDFIRGGRRQSEGQMACGCCPSEEEVRQAGGLAYDW